MRIIYKKAQRNFGGRDAKLRRVLGKSLEKRKKLTFSIDNPAKVCYTIINLIIDYFVLAFRFGTSFVHFVSILHWGFGAVHYPKPL